MWSRPGTGSAGAALAALGLALGGVAAERGALAALTRQISGVGLATAGTSSLPALIGLPAWLVILIALVGAGGLLWRLPRPAPTPGRWGWPVTGAIIGLLGVGAWVSGSRAGWHWGLSITGPSRSLLEAGLLGSPESFTWGAVMLIGIPLGSWASARLRGPFAWRAPAPAALPRRFLGGVLMGAGGTLAGGCNIGNALTGLSILSVHSLIATAAIAAGGVLGVRVSAWRDRAPP
ncbi:MAG: hypothetical protein A2X50_17405 [Candidatus Rokubacteria bacterium GWF2_70_14]|nr:MAG: hypothetical protein A2X50_17405 [Candidatus Rokubacteria bacterium GWF2_70_14]